jgi:hypothetical protein
MNTVIPSPQQTARNINLEHQKKILADGILNYIFLRLMGYVLTLMIAIIVIINEMHEVYSLIPLICCELFSLVTLCLIQQRVKGDETLFLFIFENFMFFVFLITVIINIEIGFDKMYLLILPTFHLFINLTSISYQGRKLGMPIFFLDNLIFYLCLLFVVLKLRELIEVSFYVCFWPFYLMAFILLIFIGRCLIDFLHFKQYRNARGIKVMFKLSPVILGLCLIASHLLAIIYLASKIYFNHSL